MRQATLNEALQERVREIAARQYPDASARHELPLCIALPSGIHPYNRNSGYYDPRANAIVGYQGYGRLIHDYGSETPDLGAFLQHELAHWFQHFELKYSKTSSVNVHRHRTWKQAVCIATRNLWPEYGLELVHFQPETSRRIDGRPVEIQRPGSMTDVELHHWPRSLPAFLARMTEAA